LVTTLAFVLLFFFNAELGGDHAERRYVAALRWLVIASLLLLPVLIGVAARGLWLRVGQHGWTVNRLWALLVIAMLGAYAFGYAVMILRRRGLPHTLLGRWNTVLAAVLTAALVLVISPVLDFRRVAAASQVARLERGAVAPEEFDAWYLRRLGRYGAEALERVQSGTLAAQSSELRERIDDALADRPPRLPNVAPAQLADRIVTVPGADPPEDLKSLLVGQSLAQNLCAQARTTCSLVPIVLDGEKWWVFYGTVDADMRTA